MWCSNRQNEHRVVIALMRAGYFIKPMGKSDKIDFSTYLKRDISVPASLQNKYGIKRIRSISHLVWKRLATYAEGDRPVDEYVIGFGDKCRWLFDDRWDFQPRQFDYPSYAVLSSSWFYPIGELVAPR